MNINLILHSSVGRKVTMAATGLFLALFLVEHLYGNLLLYANDGGAAFVEYSHSMTHNILIRLVEVALFGSIIIHVIQAVRVTKQNNTARPVKYAAQYSQNSTWISKNMGLTGSIILFFIIVHLYNFFVPYRITGLEPGETVATEVKEAFQNGGYAVLYLIAVVILGFHLNHGFQSAFQTLGLNDKRYAQLIKNIGTGFAIIITVGFASFPILFYFGIAGNSITEVAEHAVNIIVR